MAVAAEVASSYLCPICREVFKKPAQIRECSHRFCSQCLREIMPSKDGSLDCPICRQPFLMASSFRDKELEREVKAATFECRGCSNKLPLLMYNGHQATCKRLPKPALHFSPVAHSSHPPQVGPNRSTFYCPFCAQDNFDCNGLRDHVNKCHSSSSKPVVCPICASMPWGNSKQKSSSFVRHINLRHKFEYETYVDYSQDEEAVLQTTIQASLTDT